MIPKIIHYCWFGRGKMPAKAMYCIESWKKYLPDYELYLWNEDTFDVHQVRYVKQAYEARKFAFVTDYVRLYALYHVGGVYMDTDVEVLKSLDTLLNLPGFSGFESDTDIPTGIMAVEQHNPWAKEQLDYYTDRPFLNDDTSFDYTTNVEIISRSMQANGFLLNNTYQVYRDCMHIFPKDYFCPKTRAGEIILTPNTYCIHHFEGSWQPVQYKLKKFIFHRLLGVSITNLLVGAKRQLLKRVR
ncbi:glycosyltransferase family 32 protein [Spirosoma validum]|uniref:Glycosyl transferase n=1 Tax=Spirosoma validum TaxID=2771355 RepID=A0A927AZG2_9BACT|nr:glycosyltransferase [Spirosoma validum]MBD2752581.1 glycosyl transferase [Spirosoma validum]